VTHLDSNAKYSASTEVGRLKLIVQKTLFKLFLAKPIGIVAHLDLKRTPRREGTECGRMVVVVEACPDVMTNII
jgi:hypothetical protein